MKKYLFVLVLTLSVSSLIAQNVPNYLPKDGLVGWWPFNGNANDESGNGNNPTVNWATLTADRNGVANSAYSFNGANIGIDVLSTDLLTNFPKGQTISFWIKIPNIPTSANGPESIIEKVDSDNGYVVKFDGQGGLSYSFKSAGVWFDCIIPSSKYITNTYFNVLFTNDKDSIKGYINSVKVVSIKIPSEIYITKCSKSLKFGSTVFPGTRFIGTLDDIAIFNRALSEKEIQALYEGNSCPIKAVINAKDSVKICAGSSIVLKSTDSTHAYQWFKDNQPIVGATSKSYTATKAGQYTLKVSDPICSSVSSVTTIDTIPLPTAPALSNNYQKVCGMEPMEEISRRLTNYNSAINLKWYRNEAGNDSISKYMPLDPYPKNYFVSQLSATSPQCESPKRTMVFIDVSMPASINAKGNTTFCQGESVVLEAFATGNLYDYAWKKEYNWIEGSEGKNTFVAKESGRYSYQNRMCNMQMGGNEIIVNVKPSLKVNVGKITGSSVEFVWDTLLLSPTPKGFDISYGINSPSLTQKITIPGATKYVFTGLKKGDTVRVSITPKGTNCTNLSFVSAVAQEIDIPNNIPTNGLVGYWPFNGNANDESGNGNHGIENKINYVFDRNGKINSAINFSQDKLSKVLIAGGIKNSKGLIKTMSVWFNMPKIYPKVNYYNILISAKGPIWKYDSTSYQKEGDCIININGDLEPYPTLGYLNKISVQSEKPGNKTLVNDSVWHHLIVEVNCVDNKIKEFFDGTLVQEYKLNYYPTSISDWEILSFGNNARHCPECVFSGILDDIAIYNRALTEQEVKQLYDGCPKETATSSSFNSLLLSTGSSVSISAEPQGGVFKSTSVEKSQFIPSKAKIGMNKVQYNFKNSKGCNDSTLFAMIVADTVGTSCTKFDTITVTTKVTKYDTVIVKNTIYDTILKLKFKLTTGMQANQLASMTLYPNPTTNILHIQVGDVKALEGYRYRILDALGKVVYNELVKSTITEIPLMSLGAVGMYQFEVLDQKNTTIQTNKIVLQ